MTAIQPDPARQEEISSFAKRQSPLREWIINHDDSWLFTILYVGLAVVLSIWISLFWLVVVVGVHFVFEFIRQTSISRSGVAQRVFWECKLDVGLVLLAFVLAVYMDVVLGAAGLGGAARLGMQTGARLGGWSRAIRGVLLSLDDAAQLARVAAKRRSGAGVADVESCAAAPSDTASPASNEVRRWTLGDHAAIWLGAVSIALLLAAPLLTDHTYASAAQILAIELQPLPS